MADDAAGAVRRTPRPEPEPDADELVNQTQMLGFGVERGVATLSLKPPREIVLAWVDAARAMLGDAPNYSETRIDFPTEKAEMEVSAAGEYDRFVFTVQRAGKLTPHEARQKAEAERDALQARTAELEASLGYWKTRLGEAVAERQARIDAALARCEKTEKAVPKVVVGEALSGWWGAQDHIRAALQGDQPAEPVDAGLKARLLALRQEVLQDQALTRREVEDLKAAVLLLIMHLNHRAARGQTAGEVDRG